jgi:Flp pilus assembly protein TadG
MATPDTLSHFGSAKRLLGRCLVGRAGTAGVEFALVVPLLLLLFAGTADLGHALTVSRKIDELSSTTGDMISQQSTWTEKDVAKLLTGVSFILQPYSLTDLKITLSVVDIGVGGTATVGWSAALNALPLATGMKSDIPVPAQIQQQGVQVVVTHVRYRLTTPVSKLFSFFTGTNGYNYDRYFFSRPRAANTISYK